jgi:hypothetical protein
MKHKPHTAPKLFFVSLIALILFFGNTDLVWSQDAPAAPTDLSATSTSPYYIDLSWTDNSTDETAFEIWRSTDGTNFAVLRTVEADATTYTDNAVNSSTLYYYRVTAVNGSGESAPTSDVSATTLSEGNQALDFGSANAYVTFGLAPEVGTRSFTIEGWFNWSGSGDPNTTGEGGIDIYPMISKGAPEAEGSDLDANYMFGIQNTTNVLAADFEDMSSGANHPITGTTVLTSGVWYHGAVVFDDNTKVYSLYLNGILEASVTLGSTVTPRYDSRQHAALGTMLGSDGLTTNGFFRGILDEVRIWDYARSAEEIAISVNDQITTSQSGLIGRWGLNETAGTVVHGNADTDVDGTITGTGTTWVAGAPFNISFTEPVAPSDLVITPVSGIELELNWADNSTNESGFKIEMKTTDSESEFTQIGTVAPNVTSFRSTGLNPLTEYCFRIRASAGTLNSDYCEQACATTPISDFALQLSSDTYVTFGEAAGLATQNFTVEAWFMRTGTGTAYLTGEGGVTVVPIITKGSSEAEGSNVDENYILGINTSGNVIAADFEEGTGSLSPGLNHPLSGTTEILNDRWYHAAATFQNGKFSIYLNGVLENSVFFGANVWPQGESIQHSALGTMINSGGNAYGFFTGVIDEARVWNYGRTEQEIRSSINEEITTSQTGLLARWGLDEGSGTTVNGSAGTSFTGTIIGSGYTWVTPGAPFSPDILVPLTPSDLITQPVSDSQIQLDWADNSDNETGFEIERSSSGSTGPFDIVTTVAANAITFTDNNLESYTHYCYRVRAVNDHGHSGYSNTSCATTQTSVNDITREFQDGLNGYSGTVDTYIFSSPPEVDNSFGTEEVVQWDSEDPPSSPTSGEQDALIRFDNIFGDGANQVPIGASIVSATLSYVVVNIGTEANIFNVLVSDWNESTTWNTFGPTAGIQADEDYASSLVATTSGSDVTGVKTVDVTSSVSSWSADPSSNHGWLFRPLNINGVEIRSREFGTVSYRPKLTIVYSVNPSEFPSQPILVSPENNETDLSNAPQLQVTVSDPESRSLTVRFYGRRKTTSNIKDFTIVAIPDPQKYTEDGGNMDMFTSQTEWCVDQKDARNIVYVANEGDVTEDNNETQWARGDAAMTILESPSPGIPYGIALGNHDGAPGNTTLYNSHFGVSRFDGRSYYGGNFGTNNDNHFSLFSAGGMDFIVIDLGFGSDTPTDDVFTWANGLMSGAYSSRRAIVVTHQLLDGTNWSGPGATIYDNLKGNPNLFLMMCGHLDAESMRTDTYDGNTIYTVLSDYQTQTGGGNGWLRTFTFSPADNNITIASYSPYLDQSNWSGNPPIVLPYNMSATEPYELIGTAAGVSSGSVAEISWADLKYGHAYEWYVTVDNGINIVTGPIWSFTTEDITWTGVTNQDWNTASNWSSETVPDASDNVSIPDVDMKPLISESETAAACNNLVIDASGMLTIGPGGSLTVKGTLTVNETGTLTIESSGMSSNGSLIVEGSSTGNVTYNRTMPSGGTFHYISSPVGLTNLPAAGTFKEYDELTGEWQATTVNASGKGYTMQTDGGSVQFTGTVVKSASAEGSSPYNKGGNRVTWFDYGDGNTDEDLFVEGRSWDDYGGGGWNLLGNPFTSAMDAVKFINDNSDSFDPNYQAVYIYNGSDYSYIGSQTTGWEATMTGFGSNHIQAGQGFFVLAYYNGVTFDFDQTMQVHNTAVPMTKSAGGQDPWPGLKLIARHDSTNASSIVVYNDNMTVGVDPGYDIGLLNSGSDIEIYTTIEGNCNNFARQALPITGYEKNVIPVGINCEKGGNITFSALVVPLEDSRFYLEDRQLGLFIDLNAHEYNVTIPAQTYGTGRFYLHPSRTIITGINPQPEDSGLSDLQVWASKGQLYIKGNITDKAMCEVYDLTGHKIIDVRLTDGELNTVNMPAGSHGFFIVRIIDGNKLTTKKVIFP